MFSNKTILITGGTGSFGKKFAKKILSNHNPKKVIIYSRDELKQHNLQKDLIKFKKKLRFFIGDVRDFQRLKKAFVQVDYVIHAAALKHVPVAEYNPFEAVKTNVIGTQNVVDAALEMDRGLDPREKVPMVKINSAETLGKIADRAVQIYGARGTVKTSP